MLNESWKKTNSRFKMASTYNLGKNVYKYENDVNKYESEKGLSISTHGNSYEPYWCKLIVLIKMNS